MVALETGFAIALVLLGLVFLAPPALALFAKYLDFFIPRSK